jgi:hypothetical protein
MKMDYMLRNVDTMCAYYVLTRLIQNYSRYVVYFGCFHGWRCWKINIFEYLFKELYLTVSF